MYTSLLTAVTASLASWPLLASARAVPNALRGSNPPLATYFPSPADDPFYAVPSDIANYSPGQVIRSRTVSTLEFNTTVNTRQILHRTNDAQEEATATVTTLFIPPEPAWPPKILSLQQPEDGVDIRCAPSWANVNATADALGVQYLAPQLTPIAGEALKRGYYVSEPDFEGPTSAWLVGLIEGQMTLDGIRATINDLSLSDPEIALIGYSGGAHATVWTASLAATYAPELNIVSAAYGGTPVNLETNYNLLNGQSGSALAGGALVGQANGFPQLASLLPSVLTPEGQAIFQNLSTVDACIPETTAYANFNFSTLFVNGNPFAIPEIAYVAASDSLFEGLSPFPVPVPKFPRYEWHGEADVTVPFDSEAEYVQQQCAQGANIAFVRYPGLDHTEAYIAGIPPAIVFIEQVFNGTLGHFPCGANSTTASSTPTSTSWSSWST